MKIPQIYLIFLRLFSITTWITVFARDLLSIILYWAYYSQGVTTSRPPWISKRLPTSSAAGALNYDRWGRDLQAPSQAGHGKWHGQRASGQTQLLITLISGYANIVRMLTQGWMLDILLQKAPFLGTMHASIEISHANPIDRTTFEAPSNDFTNISVFLRWNSRFWCHFISLCFWLKCIMRHVIEGWWRHQMETFSALRPVTRSFNVFFHLRPNERLSKPSWGWWFETPSRSLWRHCNCPVDIWHYLWQIVFICLYITPYQHHHCHCANLSDDIELIKCQWDMFCRVCE